jgi:hypothetical protein
MIQDRDSWNLLYEPTRRAFIVYDADTQDEKCVTGRVVKNLHQNRDALLSCLT